MAYQSYLAAYGAIEPYAGQQQLLHDHQQIFYYAPPDLLNDKVPDQSTAPPVPDQQSLYDPFSHAEGLQQPAAPLPSHDAPPLPLEEAPPLPEEDAPPLPEEPAEVQQSYMSPSDFNSGAQQVQPVPAYLPSDLANSGYVQQPYQAVQVQQQAAASGWQTYQYTGQDAQQAQQAPWQAHSYANQYHAYSQPAPVQQSWQTQPQLPWQQQQQQHLQPQPQTSTAAAQPPVADSVPVLQAVQQAPSKIVTDAGSLFQKPGRVARPKRVAIVLRGLPGSGKSYIAKKLKDIEVQQGGDAPRIHAIDDYFVTEVEKEVMEDIPGKKPRKRSLRQMEYCYEAELEGAYKAGLLKAFERTVKEARYAMVMVDAPNVAADDLRAYWSAGQRGGYDVYILEVDHGSPQECHQRNIHNRSLADIEQAAAQWQDTPTMYPLLDVACLLGTNKKKGKQGGIAEVEMEDESASNASGEEEDQQHEPAHKLSSSRWATEADSSPSMKGSKRALAQGQGSSKRMKTEADDDYDGLTAGLDGFFGKKQGRRGMHDNAKITRGVLKKVMPLLLHKFSCLMLSFGAYGQVWSL